MNEQNDSRFKDVVLPQSEQSTLEQFVHHAIPHRPNELHEVGRWIHQQKGKKTDHKSVSQTGSASNCIASASRNARAERSGALHGALYYTETENVKKDPKRVEQSDEEVVSRMNSKEEFPQG